MAPQLQRLVNHGRIMRTASWQSNYTSQLETPCTKMAKRQSPPVLRPGQVRIPRDEEQFDRVVRNGTDITVEKGFLEGVGRVLVVVSTPLTALMVRFPLLC